jgi:hypothetical protein
MVVATHYHEPMHTFFYGWRRKVGCVTLVSACVLSGIWYRGTVIGDRFAINGYVGVSQLGVVSFGYQPDLAALRLPPEVNSEPLHVKRSFTLPNGNEVTTEGHRWHHIGPQIPLWPIVLPLTVISVYLILWKTRKADGILAGAE